MSIVVIVFEQDQMAPNHRNWFGPFGRVLLFRHFSRVGQNFIYRMYIIYSIYTVLLAGKSPNIRSYTLYIFGSGQASVYGIHIPSQ